MILRYGIFIAIFLIVLNLILTIFSLDSAPLIKWSNEILTSSTDKWALRGQIGDIMSGHFSALAFLAVALSIIFQYEANKQMRESIEKQEKAIKLQANSIEQQNKALEVQSKALEAQIEELKASREESEKQTEEFFIQNMNVKLDRYYKIIDFNLSLVFEKSKENYLMDIIIKNKETLSVEESKDINTLRNVANKVYVVLEHVYRDIQLTKKYEKAYIMLIEEFKIKIHTNFYIELLCILIKDDNLKDKYSFMNEYNYTYLFSNKVPEIS